MDVREYELMAKYEDRHWWFAARRRIIAALLNRLPSRDNKKILEVGCGSGGNLSMLQNYGDVSAVEMNDTARQHAAARHTASRIEPACLPDHMPFAGEHFDVICMFDVLEHIEDDVASLRTLHTHLAANGTLCLTVPAMPFLWSQHDVAHHHKRRYTKQSLLNVVGSAGYRPNYVSYFNTWLFIPVALVRLMQRVIGGSKQGASQVSLPAAWLNRVLETIFASERYLMGRLRLPFGVSLIMSATKA